MAAVQTFLASGAARHVTVEALPFYAPELNPTERLWQHLKDAELRNADCPDLDQLHMELHLALDRVRQSPPLVRSFFAWAGLKL